MKTVLTNCTVINCAGDTPMENSSVIIEDGTITSIRPVKGPTMKYLKMKRTAYWT